MSTSARSLLALGALCTVLTGCAPQPNNKACGQPSPQLVQTIETQISSSGQFRRPRSFSPGGSSWTFVSIEQRDPIQVKENKQGNILTFAVNTDGATILAVDQRARRDSTFGHAPFNVREKGAIESRGCVFNANA